MKAHLLGTFVLMGITLIAPRMAAGQELTTRFVFASPTIGEHGEPPVAWGGGGGVEWWAGKGTNIGGEIEGVFVPAYTAHGCCAWSSGPAEAGALFSLNGTRYLARSTNGPKWEPFITGGAGVLVVSGSRSTEFGYGPVVKFGGGVDRWLTPHRGVRFAILDQLVPTIMFGFRIGVIFR
jgi:hypothetical protein